MSTLILSEALSDVAFTKAPFQKTLILFFCKPGSDAVDPPNVYGKGRVHCELVFSTDPDMKANWTRISPGRDFIPLGVPKGEGKGEWDSHICFATGVPLRLPDEIRAFYMGGDGPHYSKPWPNSNHRNSSFGSQIAAACTPSP